MLLIHLLITLEWKEGKCMQISLLVADTARRVTFRHFRTHIRASSDLQCLPQVWFQTRVAEIIGCSSVYGTYKAVNLSTLQCVSDEKLKCVIHTGRCTASSFDVTGCCCLSSQQV